MLNQTRGAVYRYNVTGIAAAAHGDNARLGVPKVRACPWGVAGVPPPNRTRESTRALARPGIRSHCRSNSTTAASFHCACVGALLFRVGARAGARAGKHQRSHVVRWRRYKAEARWEETVTLDAATNVTQTDGDANATVLPLPLDDNQTAAAADGVNASSPEPQQTTAPQPQQGAGGDDESDDESDAPASAPVCAGAVHMHAC